MQTTCSQCGGSGKTVKVCSSSLSILYLAELSIFASGNLLGFAFHMLEQTPYSSYLNLCYIGAELVQIMQREKSCGWFQNNQTGYHAWYGFHLFFVMFLCSFI